MVLSTDLGRGAPRPEMVTATTALSGSSFSGTSLNDLMFGSCELVTGSKSTGPTSPFGVRAPAFAHNSTSALDRYLALALRRTGVDRMDDGNRIIRGRRRSACGARYGSGKAGCADQNERASRDHE